MLDLLGGSRYLQLVKSVSVLVPNQKNDPASNGNSKIAEVLK